MLKYYNRGKIGFSGTCDIYKIVERDDWKLIAIYKGYWYPKENKYVLYPKEVIERRQSDIVKVKTVDEKDVIIEYDTMKKSVLQSNAKRYK